jgi:hypothetical protein
MSIDLRSGGGGGGDDEWLLPMYYTPGTSEVGGCTS